MNTIKHIIEVLGRTFAYVVVTTSIVIVVVFAVLVSLIKMLF